jgi:hypothetical protein
MRRLWITIAMLTVLGAVAAPADARNARPRILSAELEQDGAAATVVVVGRDRDDVVRGTEISWGEDGPGQGLSACTITRGGAAGRRGARTRFRFDYVFPAAGDYTVTVRVFSGGCGERRLQRSRPRTLTVHVD